MSAMLAVDTNIVVRVLTLDNPEQSDTARKLFESHAVFLPKTVLLETEWVLRRLYGFESIRIIAALRGMIALENVECEDRSCAGRALDWAGQGMDFADALHLASSLNAGRFATFDQRLRKRAMKIEAINVVEP